MKNFSRHTFAAVMLSSLLAAPAFALDATTGAAASIQTGTAGVGVSADARVEARVTTAKSHADQEIERRTTALNALMTRINAMVRISASEKAELSTGINSQLSALSSLKVKIDGDSDIASLKADIKSITQSYRIFMLVLPQARLTVASDKMQQIASAMTNFESKIAVRIAQAQNSGAGVSALTSADADMKAKIADANVQASAAATAVASLTPDIGDDAKAAANKQALQDARAKIKASMQDLQTARKDAGTIVALLKVSAAASASGSAASTQ